MSVTTCAILLLLSGEFVFSNGQTQKMQGNVVGGNFANINAFPHAVYLEILKAEFIATVCGSSIINHMVLVSVAHCFEDSNGGEILAYAGNENIKKAMIVRSAIKTIVHENYNRKTAANDVALVFLNKMLPLGENMKRVIIRRSLSNVNTASLAGWGLISEYPEEETFLLRSISQKIPRRSVCAVLHMQRGMLCAGSATKNVPTPAPGDSGSGLITKNYELIGLLSYKVASYPALPVYMNVSYYYTWIRQSIRTICK